MRASVSRAVGLYVLLVCKHVLMAIRAAACRDRERSTSSPGAAAAQTRDLNFNSKASEWPDQSQFKSIVQFY